MLKCFYILIWITVFKLCYCHRRMGLGNDSILGKKYLVYFVKSPYSNGDDDAWICAGAIVTPTQILTAAACLVEIKNIYVIAGYKKYIHGRDIEKDKCTSTFKKRIVKISVPKEYAKSIGKQLEWMNVDLGVATVQEPYNFYDQSYLTHCSYAPHSILINHDKDIEVERSRAIALGWGEKKESKEIIKKNPKSQSKEVIKENSKPQLLQEATTTIINNTFCADLVAKNGSKELVNKYLLCASGNGFLGEDGDETTADPILEEFPGSNVSVLNNGTERGSTIKVIDSGQNNTNISQISKQISQGDDISSRKSSLPETCQNDHGGPLVAWVGTEETILGVALNGICNPNFDCVGPRIYVSTASTTDIIKCLLETNETRRKTCNDQMGDKRYQVTDIEIEWPEEVDNKTTSPLKIQQSPSNRRQLDNEETPLQIRQTRDLRDYDEHKDHQSYPRTILNVNSEEIHPDDNQQDQRSNPQENLRRNLNSNTEESLDDYIQGHKRAYSMEIRSPGDNHQNESQRPINNDESISNQPQREINNNQHISTLNPPEIEPIMPSEEYSYMQHQATFLKPRPVKTINRARKNVFKLSPFEQLPDLDLPFNVAQAESFKETGSHQFQPELSRPTQYSNNEPKQLPYDHMKMESLKSRPTASYNPLDIIMSEDQREDDDTFKHSMEKLHNPSIVEQLKQSSVNPYIPDRDNLELVKPYEQPDLGHKYQLNSPSYMQPSPSNPNRVQNILRISDHTINSSQDDTQTFEQLLSPIQEPKSGPWAPASVTTEETLQFEDLYNKPNDEKYEVSHDQEIKTQFNPIKGLFEQTGAKGSMKEGSKHEVQLRHQKPLEYPDYT